jgi:hypothetical protein
MSQRKAKRIVRELTPAEQDLVDDARQDAEHDKEEILARAREAKAAWTVMRREVESAVAALKSERERLGLSLADVELRSGIRTSVLSRLENDPTANPTMLTLQRYAAALGTELTCQLQLP